MEQNDETDHVEVLYSEQYIDVLPSMVDKYNSTYHRSIKLTPSDALYGNVRKSTSPKFHVDDKVRITRYI